MMLRFVQLQQQLQVLESVIHVAHKLAFDVVQPLVDVVYPLIAIQDSHQRHYYCDGYGQDLDVCHFYGTYSDFFCRAVLELPLPFVALGRYRSTKASITS